MDLHDLPKPWVTEVALKGDASTRRYARLTDTNGNTAIMVRYPSEVVWQVERDLRVREWCEGKGLKVPKLLDHRAGSNWAVVEDFGPEDAEHTLKSVSPGTQLRMILRLVEPLRLFSRLVPSELPRWNRPLDADRLRWELSGFELWFLRYRRNSRPPASVGSWLDDLAWEIGRHPQRVCHRDFHVNNLFLLATGEVGIIDFQDILVGPDTYDIVSCLNERATPDLLDEVRRIEVAEHWADITAAEHGWRIRARQVRLQRALKVLGSFARFEALGKHGYVPWMLALARGIVPELKAVGAPPVLIDLLLD